ncbi:Fsn [Acrasis kona]|uniref:Fsn n=1 Tax=Acrasis kona TaxID=1008807 RepID=A0AAW2ZQ19_9EUKA
MLTGRIISPNARKDGVYTIADLPRELLSLTIAFMSPKCVLNLSLTSREICSTCNSTWKKRVISLYKHQTDKEDIHKNYSKKIKGSKKYVNWKLLFFTLNPFQCKFDSKQKGVCIQVLDSVEDDAFMTSKSPEGLTARIHRVSNSGTTNHSVRTLKPLDPNCKHMFYYFELLVLHHHTMNMSIGISDRHFKLDMNFCGYCAIDKPDSVTWSLSSDGLLRNGRGTEGNPCTNLWYKYETGDRIGVLVNIRGNRLIFLKNGQKLNPLCELDLSGMLKTELYYPTVTMYHNEDQVQWVNDITIPFSLVYKLIHDANEDLQKPTKDHTMRKSDTEKNQCVIL